MQALAETQPQPMFELGDGTKIARVVLMGNTSRPGVRGQPSIKDQMLAHQAELNVAGLASTIVSTQPGGFDENAKIFTDPENADLFGPETVIEVWGGDGTANLIVNSELEAAKTHPEVAKSIHLFTAAGTECDTAKSFNSSRRLKKLMRIYKKASARNMHLLSTYVSTMEDVRKYEPGDAMPHQIIKALSYAGVGRFVNRVAGDVDTPETREAVAAAGKSKVRKRHVQARVVLNTWRDAEPMVITRDEYAEDEARRAGDILVLNSSRLAGFHHGVHRAEVPGYYDFHFQDTQLGHLLGQAARILTTRFTRRKPNTDELNIFTGSDAFLQYDGETQRIGPGTHVSFSPGPTIKVLATRRLPRRLKRQLSR